MGARRLGVCGGRGRCGAATGRLPWAGTVEWGERFGVDRVRTADPT